MLRTMSLDLNTILKDWPYESGTVKVRKITGLDGREKLQLRVDLGVLQMEIIGRPDGRRPHNCESLLEYHRKRAIRARRPRKIAAARGSRRLANGNHRTARRPASAQLRIAPGVSPQACNPGSTAAKNCSCAWISASCKWKSSDGPTAGVRTIANRSWSITASVQSGLDGREKLQLRVDLGVLQMEIIGR